MRLLILQTETFHSTGGMQAYNRAVCKAASDLVAREGGDVQLLCLNDATGDLDPRYLAADSFRGFAGDRQAFIGAALSAATRRPDRVLVGHVQLLPLAPGLRLLGAKRISCFLYGIEAWAPWPALQRLGARFCHQFLAISRFTADETRRVNRVRAPIDLLPCTLDPFWTPPALSPDVGAAEDGPRLLSVARLDASERYKGIDTTLEALVEVRKQHPTLRYWVAGDGTDRPRLEQLARDLGVADSVEFLGRIPDEELHRRYAACDLFVLPSRAEGFGIVFLEAASYRKASVGADSGAIPEVIGDGETGAVVPAGDARQLAARLLALLGDAPRVRSMGEVAFQRLQERYTYPAFGRNLAERMA